VLRSTDIEGRFGVLTAIMGGDEERARCVLEQNPQAVLRNALSNHKFGELVEICGSDEGARALVEQTATVLKGAMS
jgi:hypothetical protein